MQKTVDSFMKPKPANTAAPVEGTKSLVQQQLEVIERMKHNLASGLPIQDLEKEMQLLKDKEQQGTHGTGPGPTQSLEDQVKAQQQKLQEQQAKLAKHQELEKQKKAEQQQLKLQQLAQQQAEQIKIQEQQLLQQKQEADALAAKQAQEEELKKQQIACTGRTGQDSRATTPAEKAGSRCIGRQTGTRRRT